jgi:GWxTD domain-containing protein
LRRAETTIHYPESDKIDVTSVVLLGKNNADALGFTPITTYFIPARYDSLKFQFQVTRPDPSEDTRVLMELFSFVSDTLPAREISGIQYPQGSIGFRGIDYNRTIKIEETERILRFETGSILIEYIIPVLPSANYRFEVHINKNLESTEKAYKAREFFISSSRNFPNVQSIPEFAAPLVYLMNNREYNALKSIGGLDTLKHEVDRFWLSGIQNLNRTRQVMELYYTRVEQANKQFSNYKEGWKTDMGMIFILFGPPMYVENTLDTMTWFYSYNRNDPRTTFRFYKPRPTDQFFPYQHYILLRDRFYHSIEYDRIQNWRNGYILNLR